MLTDPSMQLTWHVTQHTNLKLPVVLYLLQKGNCWSCNLDTVIIANGYKRFDVITLSFRVHCITDSQEPVGESHLEQHWMSSLLCVDAPSQDFETPFKASAHWPYTPVLRAQETLDCFPLCHSHKRLGSFLGHSQPRHSSAPQWWPADTFLETSPERKTQVPSSHFLYLGLHPHLGASHA